MTKATKGSDTLTFAYNADGLRTSKTVNGVVHNYYYADGKLVRETYGDTVLDFFYDASGYPYIMKMGNNIYYYITNAQGDVIRLTDIHGNTAAYYQYDPYGKVIHASGSHANINPLKYRGYLHDTETSLYYLQSRYYDPEVGRFINADAFASTGQGLLGNNAFAYCNSNPCNYADGTGTSLSYYNPLIGPPLSNYYYVGGNATGASTATAAGGGGGFPIAVVGLSIPETLDLVDTISDISDAFGNLSHAAEYGIQSYSDLRKATSGTGLEAHHIVEQRFLIGKGMNVQTAASVAVTPQEHQKFTNLWRRHFPYGKTNYNDLPKEKIWSAAQIIYQDYPELLDAVWDTIRFMD